MNSAGPLILLEMRPIAAPPSSPDDIMILSPLRSACLHFTLTFDEPWPSLQEALFRYGIGTGPPGVGVLHMSVGPVVRH